MLNLLLEPLGYEFMRNAIASLSGVYLSYYHNLPSEPMIVLAPSSLFLLALLFSPSQGILMRSTAHEPSNPFINRFKPLSRNN